MGSLARAMRRRLARTSGTTPYGSPEMMRAVPGKMMLSIVYGEATLNWNADVKDIDWAYQKMNAARPGIEKDLDQGPLSDQAFKEEVRNIVIFGMERNEHIDRTKAKAIMVAMMWYAWLKRESWLQTEHLNGDWSRIQRLIMHIEARPNRWYDFKWEIKFREAVELPELERINVWTAFRKH
jgi:hypothetical protein